MTFHNRYGRRTDGIAGREDRSWWEMETYDDNYEIQIQGKQIQDGEENKIHVNTTGSYTKKGETRYISYREYEEDNPSKTHISVIKVEPGIVTVIQADSATRLILEEGKRHLCLYNTEFGALTLGIFTSVMRSTLDDRGGSLNVKYTLDVDSHLTSSNEIDVLVKRRRRIQKERDRPKR